MANDEFRADQAAAREAGLKARQERRLENATYTAAEVKVLTEAALRLGRKEAGEEIAQALEGVPALWMANSSAFDDGIGRRESVRIARDIGSQPSPDATSEPSEAPGYSDLPQNPQAAPGGSNG